MLNIHIHIEILFAFMACLGLFGLAVYFCQQRTKETGPPKPGFQPD